MTTPTIPDRFDAAAARYHNAHNALQAAFDLAIPPDHPLRVELREASEALDSMVEDRDLMGYECST